jgi:hypothetical protein
MATSFKIPQAHPNVTGLHIGLVIAAVLLVLFFFGRMGGQTLVPPGWLSWASYQRYAQSENQVGVSWSTRSAYSN